MSLKDTIAETGVKTAWVVDDDFDPVVERLQAHGPACANLVASVRELEFELGAAVSPELGDLRNQLNDGPPEGAGDSVALAALMLCLPVSEERNSVLQPVMQALIDLGSLVGVDVTADGDARTMSPHVVSLCNALSHLDVSLCKMSRIDAAALDGLTEDKRPQLVFHDLILDPACSPDSGQVLEEHYADAERSIRLLQEYFRDQELPEPVLVLMSGHAHAPTIEQELVRALRAESRIPHATTFCSKSEFSLGALDDSTGSGVSPLDGLLYAYASAYRSAATVGQFANALRTMLEHDMKEVEQALAELEFADYASLLTTHLYSEGEPPSQFLIGLIRRTIGRRVSPEHRGIFNAMDRCSHEIVESIRLGALGTTPGSFNRLLLQTSLDEVVGESLSHPLSLSDDDRRPLLGLGDLLIKDGTAEWQYPDALVVVSPSCDLMWSPASGSTRPFRGGQSVGFLRSVGVGPESQPPSDGRGLVAVSLIRSKIWEFRFDIKALETRRYDECWAYFEGERYRRHGRLDETSSLQLQQRLLSDLGRVGLPTLPSPGREVVMRALVRSSAEGEFAEVRDCQVFLRPLFSSHPMRAEATMHLQFRPAFLGLLSDAGGISEIMYPNANPPGEFAGADFLHSMALVQGLQVRSKSIGTLLEGAKVIKCNGAPSNNEPKAMMIASTGQLARGVALVIAPVEGGAIDDVRRLVNGGGNEHLRIVLVCLAADLRFPEL